MSHNTRRFDGVVVRFLNGVVHSLKNQPSNEKIAKNIYLINLIRVSPHAGDSLYELTDDGFKNGSHAQVKRVVGCLRRVHNTSPMMSIKWRIDARIAMAKYHRLNKCR